MGQLKCWVATRPHVRKQTICQLTATGRKQDTESKGERKGGTELQMRLKGGDWERYFILCGHPGTRAIPNLSLHHQELQISTYRVNVSTHSHMIALPLYLFFFMMCSKGLRKSFWNLKLASSPFSKNFMDSCRRESTAKMATSSLGLHPTYTKTEQYY